ncbi:MAG: hypothetical protein JWQ89_4427 [Devosia sp.]|uniref:hypothetical protein n=1 Tax=Devosia sp. TaxID=1871048 RepID=UPI00261CEEB0|nr:hypothetical protein [Devosia sp.]MDB5542700.1 hypothetical protein [Devosia sp.]
MFRSGLAGRSPALRSVFDLCAGRLHLVTEAVGVRIADYPKLGVEDFMVSIYNDHTVQRVLLALPDGGRVPVHPVLAQAMAFLRD